MAVMTAKQNINGWIMEKLLGQGGFGAVYLYRHETDGRYLAIKQCRQSSDDIPDRLKSRWTLECDIMIRLKHPNVVRGYALPPELQELAIGDLPVLSMEYCQHGDLRKVLNRPENICGLPEYQVRQIARDAAAGVEYLHSQRVVHRDLKPENIVMQPSDHRITYKLIDLGYAKDLSQDSICMSYVGTLQYLAPELQKGPGSQQYTSTVDYWSLGTTVFECICGVRPFPTSADQQKWLDLVGRKNKMHICATGNDRGEMEYSEKLPSPNHLCSLSQGYFELWLRYMLLFDPAARGGGPANDASKRPKCFVHLDKIMSTKLIHIYCVQTNEVLSYPVRADSGSSSRPMTIENLSIMMRSSTTIDGPNQELLTLTGTVAEIGLESEKYCSDQEDKNERDIIDLFLFSKANQPNRPDQRKSRPLPKHVQMAVNNREKDNVYSDQLLTCKQVIYYCGELVKDFSRLMDAQNAANLCLMREKTTLFTSICKLKEEYNNLVAKIEFFNQSVQVDQAEFRNQRDSSGTFSQIAYDRWESRKNEVSQFNVLMERVSDIDAASERLNLRILELQRSPCAKDNLRTRIQEFQRQGLQIYNNLRSLPQDQKFKAAFTPEILNCVELCYQECKQRSEELCIHIGKLIGCKLEIVQLGPLVSETLDIVNKARDSVVKYQKQRQKDIWNIVSKITDEMKKKATLATSPERPLASSVGSPPVAGSRPPFAGGGDLIALESMKLQDESIDARKKMEELLSRLSADQQQQHTINYSMDWSFLNP